MVFRTSLPDDQNFILNSWVKTIIYDRELSRDAAFAYRDIVVKLLQRAQVLLAIDQEDPSFVLAYVCFEKCNDLTTIHFCYTKKVFRQMGVMHELFARINAEKEKTIATFSPKKSGKYFYRHINPKFEPRLIYYPLD